MDEIKAGATVELKSGGPVMTALRYDKERDRWYCQWFAATELKGDWFAPWTLKTVNTPR
jgi:uncharacterized protein YodC (DUF2158 family)